MYTPAVPRGSKQTRDRLNAAIYHILVASSCFIMLYPILWMIASSLKPTSDIWTTTASLIPRSPTIEHYINGWAGFGTISFSTFYKNSLIYATVGTVAAVASSACVAYAFAKIRFVGRKFWFSLMLLTLMLPGQVLMIPQYIVFSKLGWINSFLPLLVPRFFGNAFFVFLIIQFMRGIPIELDEAAEIDGCSKIGIFFRITLPLIQPALITAAIFSFYWTWEDFLGPLLYLQDPHLYTVSLAIRSYSDPSAGTNWGSVFAMSSLSLAPVFAIFIIFQRYLVEGISTTGLKG
ncbi:MAG TPA: carbohydrate ABC transporter permease [Chloroflexi bacterium]|nr:carbohydrate ABC transporter permease [Chloroflexota bacterium]